MPNPIQFLHEAVKAVPAVKYAVGVGGVIAAVAIVYSFKLDPRVAFVGGIVTLILMGVLVVFARMVALSGSRLQLPALVFTWFVLLLFMLTSITLFSSVFFQAPLDLRNWLQPTETTTTATEATTLSEPPVPAVIDASWSLTMPLPNDWSGLALNVPSLPQGWFGTSCRCARPMVLPVPIFPLSERSIVELPNNCGSEVDVAIGKLEQSSVGPAMVVARTRLQAGSVFKADVGGSLGFAVLVKRCPGDA